MSQSSTPPDNQLTILGTLPTKIVGVGYMGEYRSGLWQIFDSSGTFTVPSSVTKIRVRVLGAGCGGTNAGRGGCGGGYAFGEFTVTPGAAHTVIVGAGSVGGVSPSAGGTTSFGALISATGGTTSAGGVGVGGDYQSTGGVSGNTTASGGGASGSQLGDGGRSAANASSGGGGVSSNASSGVGTSGGASAFGAGISGVGGPDIISKVDSSPGATGDRNPINAIIRFPTDCFVGGGGTVPGGNGGSGSGGAGNNSGTGGNGGICGGGGGGTAVGGNGGLGGGGGGGTTTGGDGGNGLCIVEF